jgi:hypothetical protein
MKILNGIFTLLFILFAGLQYNDPDPYVWIPIYLYAALLCGLAVSGKHFPRAYGLGIAVYGLYALYLLLTTNGVLDWYQQHQAESLVQTMKAEKPWIEDTREFGGLLILILALSLNWIYGKKNLKSSS